MDEDIKGKIRAALKGRVPWNKGCEMSASTKEKMRLAKMGTKHSITTRRRMSMAHTGKRHSAKTMKKLSQKLTGLPKSAEHRKKISVSQKRRCAANRALKAIEEAHKEAGALYGNEAQQTSPNPNFTTYFHQTIDRKLHSKEKRTRAEVLKMYKAMLGEYRRLQSELSPWMKAFEVKNGRRPLLSDVEATQIPWLMSTFKQYLLMRDKLLRHIPFLRTAMVEAPKTATEALLPNGDQNLVPHPEAEPVWNVPTETDARKPTPSMSKMERMEALAGSPLSSDRVKHAMTAAMQYRRSKPVPSRQAETKQQRSPSTTESESKRSHVQAKAIAALHSLQKAQQDYATLLEETKA